MGGASAGEEAAVAIGSKHANATIWARWRGGKPLRSARALRFLKYRRDAVLFIAATDSPDGCRIALHLDGHGLDPLPSPNGQEDAGVLDLEPRLRATSGDVL